MRFFIVVTCFFLKIALVFAAEYPACLEHHCTLIVDAGSTGSRALLYAYDKNDAEQPINIHTVWSKKINPGFASITPDQNTIDNYLTTLFKDVPTQDVPVYFYATAGMRLQSEKNQAIYYQHLHTWFRHEPEWKLQEARTITGQEEAVFGWLFVNYIVGGLYDEAIPLTGVLDIGGASVQVTIPVPENAYNLPKEDVIYLNLGSRHIALLAHSFLGLGSTEMTRDARNDAVCFPEGYVLDNAGIGLGDALSCRETISVGMQKQSSLKAFATLLYPYLQETWYVIGGAAAIATDEALHMTLPYFTQAMLLQQANDYVCQVPTQQLSLDYPNNNYIQTQCLFAAYTYSLFVDGFQFAPEQAFYHFDKTQDTSWTMGVVLKNKG